MSAAPFFHLAQLAPCPRSVGSNLSPPTGTKAPSGLVLRPTRALRDALQELTPEAAGGPLAEAMVRGVARPGRELHLEEAGCWFAALRPPRVGIHPATGAEVPLPARLVLRHRGPLSGERDRFTMER